MTLCRNSRSIKGNFSLSTGNIGCKMLYEKSSRLKNWSIIVRIHDLKGLVRQKFLLVFAHSSLLKDDLANPSQLFCGFSDVNSIKIRFIAIWGSDFHFLFSSLHLLPNQAKVLHPSLECFQICIRFSKSFFMVNLTFPVQIEFASFLIDF